MLLPPPLDQPPWLGESTCLSSMWVEFLAISHPCIEHLCHSKFTFIVGLLFYDVFQVLVVYNFLCSALSLYSLAVIVKAYCQAGMLYTFAMVHDASVKHAFLIYWITKYLELLDTVFMIVRHRQRQITFLHVSFNIFATSFPEEKGSRTTDNVAQIPWGGGGGGGKGEELEEFNLCPLHDPLFFS